MLQFGLSDMSHKENETIPVPEGTSETTLVMVLHIYNLEEYDQPRVSVTMAPFQSEKLSRVGGEAGVGDHNLREACVREAPGI